MQSERVVLFEKGSVSKKAHSSWVSARRGPNPVSSRSPLRTGLATLMASGSAPLIVLHGVTMKRRFPFLQFHRDSPVYSLRVHWVPLFPSSQRLGAFAVSPRPGVPSFPGLRLLTNGVSLLQTTQ